MVIDFNTVFDIRTVGGVSTATLILVELVKSMTKGTRLEKVPFAVWILSIAGGLTLLAYNAGYTVGQSYASFALSAILSAIASSGMYTWVTGKPLQGASDKNDPPPGGGASGMSSSTLSTMLLVLLSAATLLGSSGCAWLVVSPRERAFHAGIKESWSFVKSEYVAYVENDPDMTAIDKAYRIGDKNSVVSEFDGLISDEEKAIDHAK